jgi:hypothetical protein
MSRVSISIPTYNRADIIGETLATILNQSYSDFELVIVDNASTDNTEAVVRSIDDPRLRYVRNPTNLGLILNQNRCIEEASNEFVAVYHDHDFYHPDLVKKSLEIFDTHPTVGVVCCAVHTVDPVSPDLIKRTDIRNWTECTPGRVIRRELLHRWDSRITAPTAMVRKVCYEQAGVFRPEVGGGADRELWLRILRSWDLGYIATPMARLRDRPTAVPVDRSRAAALAAEHWHQLAGQVRIQTVHMEQDFAHSPLRLMSERARLKTTALREFWRWEMLMLAKGHEQACAQAADAFQQAGLTWSSVIAAWLHRSQAAKTSLSVALRTYRKLVYGAYLSNPS